MYIYLYDTYASYNFPSESLVLFIYLKLYRVRFAHIFSPRYIPFIFVVTYIFLLNRETVYTATSFFFGMHTHTLPKY